MTGFGEDHGCLTAELGAVVDDVHEAVEVLVMETVDEDPHRLRLHRPTLAERGQGGEVGDRQHGRRPVAFLTEHAPLPLAREHMDERPEETAVAHRGRLDQLGRRDLCRRVEDPAIGPLAIAVEDADLSHPHAVLPLQGPAGWIESDQFILWPRVSSRPPIRPDVPEQYASLAREAGLILADSPRASAVLSRRCLQQLLRNEAKAPRPRPERCSARLARPGAFGRPADPYGRGGVAAQLAAPGTHDHAGRLPPMDPKYIAIGGLVLNCLLYTSDAA